VVGWELVGDITNFIPCFLHRWYICICFVSWLFCFIMTRHTKKEKLLLWSFVCLWSFIISFTSFVSWCSSWLMCTLFTSYFLYWLVSFWLWRCFNCSQIFVHVSITGGSQVQLSHAFTGYVLGYSKANKVYALCGCLLLQHVCVYYGLSLPCW
jgi:hypothetical protein